MPRSLVSQAGSLTTGCVLVVDATFLKRSLINPNAVQLGFVFRQNAHYVRELLVCLNSYRAGGKYLTSKFVTGLLQPSVVDHDKRQP